MLTDNKNPKWLHKFEIKPDRWVFHPTDCTKEKGRKLKNELTKIVKIPANYWHLRKGGHVDAMHSHLENRYFLKLDISDFFGSVNRSRVTRVLKPYFGYKKARSIAIESTVRHPNHGKYILPYGFVQSALLASMALSASSLGACLRDLQKLHGCIVSVYVDDIIISASSLNVLEQSFITVGERAKRSGFQFKELKKQGPSHKITAFNIELSFGLLKITDARMISFAKALDDTENEFVRKGIRNYVKSVNVDQARMI